MTSLDMRGVSISILPLTDLTLARLDSPTDAPGWIQMKQPVSSSQITIPVTKGPVLCFERFIIFFANNFYNGREKESTFH